MSVRIFPALTLLFLAFACGGDEPEIGRPVPDVSGAVRAIWVTRFDYKTEADVREAVKNCAAAGFDTLMWQVRGNATAFYRSTHEPWAEQLGWQDPGFDPLALAIREARDHDLEIHAWVNVVTGWWGGEPPENTAHLYHTHPEWFWYDQHKTRQPLQKEFYVSLNPCLPEVRLYLARVVGEIAAKYDVDGVHFDYLRFPNEPPVIPTDSDIDYPRDRQTVDLYRQASGKLPDEDRAAWSAWRTEQVTELLREMGAVVRRVKPRMVLSAAVGPVPEAALQHFQDADAWLNEGLIDLVFPMNYTDKGALFDERLAHWSDRRNRVVMGVRLGSGELAERRRQLRAVNEAFGSFCVFAYSALFDSPNETIDSQAADARARRAERRAELSPLLLDLAGD